MTLTDLGPKPKTKKQNRTQIKSHLWGGNWEYSQLDCILDITHVNFLSCDNGIMVM